MYLFTCAAVNIQLALQGALHHQLTGNVSGVRVSASCDKHPTSNTQLFQLWSYGHVINITKKLIQC